MQFTQISINRDTYKWLDNGNVEVTLCPETLRSEIDLVEFNEFMESQLRSSCSVRMVGGNLIFVAENDSILQAIPKHRYRFRTKLAAWLESFYEVIFALGLIFLALVLFYLLHSVSPNFYKNIPVVLWEFFKSLLSFLWDALGQLLFAIGVALGLNEPNCP